MIPAIFLFFNPLAFDSYVLPKIALAAVLLAVAWARGRRWGAKPLTVPLLVMFACVAVSAALSGDVLVNVFGRESSRYYALLPLSLCLVAYHLPPVRLHVPMRWAGGLMAAYALSQYLWTPFGREVLARGRVIGSIGNPPMLGAALAMCFPFCFGRTPRRVLLAALVMAGIIATGSRGPILGAAVGAVVFDPPRSRGAELAALLMVGCVIVLTFQHGASDLIRARTWAMSLQIWSAHPWFGAGAETYVDAWRAFRDARWMTLVGATTMQDQAHNDLLEVLAAFGAVGAAAYSWLLWRVWARLRERPLVGDNVYFRSVLGSLAALFVCAKFNAVPFPCLFAAALLLGAQNIGGRTFSRWWPAAGCALAAAWLSVACVIDMEYQSARILKDASRLHLAARANPSEAVYSLAYANALLLSGHAAQAIAESRRVVLLHPGSVQAAHALALNLAAASRSIPELRGEALRAGARAESLDPMVFAVIK